METLLDRDTTSGLLAAVRASRSVEDSAARETLILAARYAAANMVDAAGGPVAALDVVDGGEVVEPLAGQGAPLIAEGAVVEFAAVLGYSTYAGRKFLADAVEIRWRLPRVWARILDGTLTVFRARRVAEVTRCLGSDAAAYVDQHVASVAHKTGVVQLERVAREAAALFEPEVTGALADQADEQRRCAITTDPGLTWIPGGSETAQAAIPLAAMDAVLDAADAVELEEAVASIAHGLLDSEATDGWSLDMRRSAALGVLARAYNAGHMPDAPGTGRMVDLVIHTDTRELAGTGLVRFANTRGLATMERLARWVSMPGVVVKRTVVVDLAEEVTTEAYPVTAGQRRQAELLHEKCSFPHCHKRADRCDIDHRVPYNKNGPGGRSTTSNLTPLCRKHHRVKTHMRWSYQRLGPAVYRWRSPHGYEFLVGPEGTVDISTDLEFKAAEGERTSYGWIADLPRATPAA